MRRRLREETDLKTLWHTLEKQISFKSNSFECSVKIMIYKTVQTLNSEIQQKGSSSLHPKDLEKEQKWGETQCKGNVLYVKKGHRFDLINRWMHECDGQSVLEQ